MLFGVSIHVPTLEGGGGGGEAVTPEVRSQSSGSGTKRGHDEVGGDGTQVQGSRAVQQKTGLEMLQALKEVQVLKADGIIDSSEAEFLKSKILSEHV